jgi:hypothetical protein
MEPCQYEYPYFTVWYPRFQRFRPSIVLTGASVQPAGNGPSTGFEVTAESDGGTHDSTAGHPNGLSPGRGAFLYTSKPVTINKAEQFSPDVLRISPDLRRKVAAGTTSSRQASHGFFARLLRSPFQLRLWSEYSR